MRVEVEEGLLMDRGYLNRYWYPNHVYPNLAVTTRVVNEGEFGPDQGYPPLASVRTLFHCVQSKTYSSALNLFFK